MNLDAIRSAALGMIPDADGKVRGVAFAAWRAEVTPESVLAMCDALVSLSPQP